MKKKMTLRIIVGMLTIILIVTGILPFMTNKTLAAENVLSDNIILVTENEVSDTAKDGYSKVTFKIGDQTKDVYIKNGNTVKLKSSNKNSGVIAGGIEKFCKVAIPALFIILVGLAIYAVTLNGANQGLQYLFTVKKEYILSPNTWIQAFIQAAWSTGAGWGFIMTYANYVGEEEDVPTSCLIMGLGDNLGAILSALVVIPAICALSATPEAANEALSQGNFGLTFIYIYQLFTTIPGGRFISFIFFGLLAIAAITSLFSMIEVGVKCVVDLGLPRKKAVVSVCFAGFLVGCFSCWSLVNIDNQDWVWGIGLLVSGAFIAILAWKYGVEKLRTQEVNAKGADVHLPKAYYTGCMYLIPVLVVIMVVYWLLQTKEWFPDTWLNPFIIQDNTGTVLLQFGVVILVGLALSKFFNTKTAKGAMKNNEAGK